MRNTISGDGIISNHKKFAHAVAVHGIAEVATVETRDSDGSRREVVVISLANGEQYAFPTVNIIEVFVGKGA